MNRFNTVYKLRLTLTPCVPAEIITIPPDRWLG